MQKQKGSDDSGGGSNKLSRKSRSSITSLDNQIPGSTISSDGNYVCLSGFLHFVDISISIIE